MLQKCNDELEPKGQDDNPLPMGQLTHTKTMIPEVDIKKATPEMKNMLKRMKENAHGPTKKVQASNPA